MPRKTAQDFDQELLILFDAYVHGLVDRRGFLEKAQKFAVGGATAVGLLAALSPDFALGQVVAKDDARLSTRMVDIPSPAGYGSIKGYLAQPAKAQGKLPTILVVHENRGLNPHIEDIARRLALEGYLVLAPDALTPLGGYPGDEDKAREAFAKLDQAKTREDFVAAAAWLQPGHGQAGCGRILLWRRHGAYAVAAPAVFGSWRAFLRQPARAGGGHQGQGTLAAALCGGGRTYQRRLARVRGRTQGRWGALHRPPVPGHPTWLQQRHHAAL